MEWQHWLVLVSVLISLSGGVTYIREMFRGNAKPNLVSWGMWALAPLIATGAALSADADIWGTARVFISGFVPFSIFALGLFIPQSYWKLTRFDLFCGLLSAVALVAWLAVDALVLAILLAVAADLLASIPTLTKAWRNPETESEAVFFMGLLASIITIPAIPIWNLENTTFQVYLIVVNLALFGVVFIGKHLRRSTNQTPISLN